MKSTLYRINRETQISLIHVNNSTFKFEGNLLILNLDVIFKNNIPSFKQTIICNQSLELHKVDPFNYIESKILDYISLYCHWEHQLK